jgi:sRNA-binding carbon storage regulator CsrA
MLYINVKIGQSVYLKVKGAISDHVIECTLTERHGNYVQLGIEADRAAVEILREKVWREQQAAAAVRAASNEAANHPPRVAPAVGAPEPEQHPAAGAHAAGSPAAAAAVPEYERSRVRGEVSGVEVDPT